MANFIQKVPAIPQQINNQPGQKTTSNTQNTNNFNNVLSGPINTQAPASNPFLSSANTEPGESYFKDGWKLLANAREDQGVKDLKTDFSNLDTDTERTEFVGKLFSKAGDLTKDGQAQMLGHNLNGALNLMDDATKGQFCKALNQAYNNGAISKEDLAAVLSDESIKVPQASKTPTGSVAEIVDAIKATGNDKLMGDSLEALWSELTTDKNVDLTHIRHDLAAGSKQDDFVDGAIELATEMQKSGNHDGIMQIVDTFNNPDTNPKFADNFFEALKPSQWEAPAIDKMSAPDKSGKLNDFIDALAKANPTSAKGAADAKGINDSIENTVQRLLPHIEKGDHHSINAMSQFLLNGTTKDADGHKDYSKTHLQRFLTESTQSAGNHPNEADDNSLMTDVIRHTALNQGDLHIAGGQNIANAIGDLAQQNYDKVNDLDLTSADRKQSANELGALLGSIEAATTHKLNTDKTFTDYGVDLFVWFARKYVPSEISKPTIDGLNQVCDIVKDCLSNAASSDTAEVRTALDNLTTFEDKVIDTTAMANQPIGQITDAYGNLTDPVKTALGAPDAQTLDDLTPGQRFQLQQRLDGEATTQEIPAMIREAIDRVTS